MSTQAVILAGGKGTRSADPTRPKLSQEIAGDSLLQWHLRLLAQTSIKNVAIVAGYLGDQVADLVGKVDTCGCFVTVIQEREQKGTVAATRLAAEQTDADKFLVILGDVLLSLPLDRFLNEWDTSQKNVAVVTHPSTHPEDSDAVIEHPDGRVQVIPKTRDRHGIPNMSSAGLFAISRTGLDKYGNHVDLGSNLIEAAANNSDLFADVSSHYLKDTGTPERLKAATQDVHSGVFARRGNLDLRPAIFLDRDGVINPAFPEYYTPEGYELLPEVAETIRDINRDGVPTFVVTNQPGIAKGFMTFEDHFQVRAAMDGLLSEQGAFVDDYEYCPHHPEKGFAGERAELKLECTCRKPAPGMLVTLAGKHGLDLSRSILVGDTERDEGAARQAGTGFIRVDGDSQFASSHAIQSALEVVTC